MYGSSVISNSDHQHSFAIETAHYTNPGKQPRLMRLRWIHHFLWLNHGYYAWNSAEYTSAFLCPPWLLSLSYTTEYQMQPHSLDFTLNIMFLLTSLCVCLCVFCVCVFYVCLCACIVCMCICIRVWKLVMYWRCQVPAASSFYIQ